MRFRIVLLSILLGLSACTFETPVLTPGTETSSPVVPPGSDTPRPTVLRPTPYPDTPSPGAIDAPVIETPELIEIQFLDKLDGWGVTETEIARTTDGGITWYDVTPPDMDATAFSVETFFLDQEQRFSISHKRWRSDMEHLSHSI